MGAQASTGPMDPTKRLNLEEVAEQVIAHADFQGLAQTMTSLSATAIGVLQLANEKVDLLLGNEERQGLEEKRMDPSSGLLALCFAEAERLDETLRAVQAQLERL